jgi:N,N'-diacetyllegionaminate synthase
MLIKKGDIFTEENLAVKRPGDGISPMQWDQVIGKKATQDFGENEYIIL